ncbi:hypothetical protein ANCCEY_06952 [Ancylostoma ceylanicum]|uniref:Uncharacterized protein n=1 Tax=Ancylostoma ceylanicum TaxID=53326 RepID=A0A0D6LRW9_9BILA|nr:hypothetical protein ANCCEY_06952 [Ancylostoma ceylanicum]
MLSRLSSRGVSTSAVACRASSVFADKNEIAFPIHGKQPKVCSVKEAFKSIKSGVLISLQTRGLIIPDGNSFTIQSIIFHFIY